ncbi:related to oxidoreductase [Rhynchosporium secalis]|uniref:Related to oxidoreductase n=1 Tax=Rhynchosporium secalis TaxID=38038 RepID=A0A1E1M1C9_RHYSE|nr:related to oxidoreductase [Rhynchosporium secalis]
MTQEHVLVTGSSGHLGCALMHLLPNLGYTPIGLDIRPSETTTTVGSITDASILELLFTKYEFHSIIHAATLHKPHIESHTKSDFINVNVTGTTLLLDLAAAASDPKPSFIYISSTSAFGNALSPSPGNPASWIDESVVPKPKNIYGVTKICAEDICALVSEESGLNVAVLRIARFFPEDDDVKERRERWTSANLKVNELCYRRLDLDDVVAACVAAMRTFGTSSTDGSMNEGEREGKGKGRFGMYIISAPSPFSNDAQTLALLDSDPSIPLQNTVPSYEPVFGKLGWRFLDRIDRVYDSSKARRELGWEPVYTFERALKKLRKGEEWRSEISLKVGRRGYHEKPTGVYTLDAIGSEGSVVV